MRVLFLSFDAAMQALGGMFTSASSAQWLSQLAADLAAHPDVELALHRETETTYPLLSAEVMMRTVGQQITAIVGPNEVEGTIESFLSKRPEVKDFVLLENDLDELSGPLEPHVVICDLGLGLHDSGAAELREWLAGATRPRGTFAMGPLPPSAQQRSDRSLLATLSRPDRVIAEVTVLLPEFELVHLEAPGGLTVSVGEDTPGVDWRALEVGQLVECELDKHVTRVIKAKLLSHGHLQPGPRTDEGPTE